MRISYGERPSVRKPNCRDSEINLDSIKGIGIDEVAIEEAMLNKNK